MDNPCQCTPGRYADRLPDERDYLERLDEMWDYLDSPSSSDDEGEKLYWRGYVRPEPRCGPQCRAYYRYETDSSGQKWLVSRGERTRIEKVDDPPPDWKEDE